MTPQQIVEKTKEALVLSLRQASVAKLEPPSLTSDLTSSFGGGFFMDPMEPWPASNGCPLLPILQIRIDELPYVHPKLKQYSLVQVFVENDYDPDYDRTCSGSSWLLKTYQNLNGLVATSYPAETDLKQHAIRWHLVENETPNWDDLGSALGHELATAFCRLDSEYTDWFYDNLTCEVATKIGGWTRWIQNSVTDHPIIQIETEKEAGWAWPGGGFACIYFNEDSGDWHMWVDMP